MSFHSLRCKLRIQKQQQPPIYFICSTFTGLSLQARSRALKTVSVGQGGKEGRNFLARLRGSWRSHLFPLQNVPAGQSYRRRGTRDGFIFQCMTAGELFLCSHMKPGGADESVRGRRREMGGVGGRGEEAPLLLDVSRATEGSPHQMFPEPTSRGADATYGRSNIHTRS